MPRQHVLDAFAAIEKGAQPATVESEILDFKEHRGSKDDLVRHTVDAAICFAMAEAAPLSSG